MSESGNRDAIVRRSTLKPSTRKLPSAKGLKDKGTYSKRARIAPNQHAPKLPKAKTRVRLEPVVATRQTQPTLQPTPDYSTNSLSVAPDHIIDPNSADNIHRTLYVVTFVKPMTGFMGSFHTTLVRKPQGSLHAGLLNLPGGKVKKGEKPHRAAVRELYEETGIEGTFPSYIGAIRDKDRHWDVLVYTVISTPGYSRSPVNYIHHDTANPGVTHDVLSVDICDPSYRNQMVPNLPLVLSLCATNIRGWSLQEGAWFKGLTHENYTGVLSFHPRPTAQQDRPRTPKSDVGIAR